MTEKSSPKSYIGVIELCLSEGISKYVSQVVSVSHC